MGRLLLIPLLLAGCTCDSDPSTRHTLPPPARSETQAEERTEPSPRGWPAALVELEPLPSATRVTLFGARIEVDNGAMVDLWPATAVELAQTAPDPDWPSWPRMHAVIEEPIPRGRPFEALLAVLRTARRAERSSTGSGNGSNVYDVRAASRVAFEDFERVLYTAAHAGYGSPRVVLGEDDAPVRLEWPHAPPSAAPSQDQIREALAAIARGEEPVLPATEDRWIHLALADGRVDTTLPCDLVDDAPAVAVCARDRDISLSVERTATMGDVLPWVQHLSRTSGALRVVSR